MNAPRPLPPRGRRALFVAALAALLITGCGQGAASTSPNREATSPKTVETTASLGTDGGDVLNGTERDDALRAGGGDDKLSGGEGRDDLYGGPGDDVIDAQDPGSVGAAGRDVISCGPGRDEVLMDAEDRERPRGCEAAGVGAS